MEGLVMDLKDWKGRVGCFQVRSHARLENMGAGLQHEASLQRTRLFDAASNNKIL